MTQCPPSPTKAHHWMVPTPSGNITEIARCKYCKESKELHISFDESPAKYLRFPAAQASK